MTDATNESQFTTNNPLRTKREIVEQLRKYREEVRKNVHEMPGVVTEISCVSVINTSLILMKQLDNLIITLSRAITKEESRYPLPANIAFNAEGTAIFKPPVIYQDEWVDRSFIDMRKYVFKNLDQTEVFKSLLDANENERLRQLTKNESVDITDTSRCQNNDDKGQSESSEFGNNTNE